jgi:predicted Zn finger-like uncharacterized protein
MKISCQSCHSKYNVADEKVQGKIVKIRCRKCGATIVVNASGGASANGLSSAPAPPTTPDGVAAGSDAEWHVSVADNDQRTMSLAELVTAYNAGVVAQDTFVWTEGMGDWKPLSEVEAVVSALHAAAEQPPAAAVATGYEYGLSAPPVAAAAAPPVYEAAAPAAPARAQAPAYEGGFAAQARSEAEPRRAAVVKREARARDLFATRSGEELQTSSPATHASAPPVAGDDSRLTGQRNENSVLFSLDHLTRNAEPQHQRDEGFARTKDDSGLIDLKALSAKAESMRPPTLHDGNALSSPLGVPPALGFASPLGAPAGFGPGADSQPKSKLPLLIGAGAGVALLLVLGIVIGLKIGGGAAAPSAVASASAAPSPIPSATAEPAPSATAAASAPTAPHASASASAAPVAAAAPKPRPFGGGVVGGGSAFKQGAAAKPAGAAGAGGGTSPAAGPAAGGAAAGGGGGAAPAAPAKKGDCGCNGDLMCMMKCSTH